jgi:hypothetical protein
MRGPGSIGLSVPARFHHQRPRFGGVFVVDAELDAANQANEIPDN